ncbi:hypothetical protein BCU71_05655 [Vibrio lentus]|uniref:hypothetical protein n=1 Tax=Vibrio lentus TaxID=136468 RepID=UPI000C83D9D1|nr:hypothetical protein [Vibrio lentus]PMH28051.1 hypothetical protein BCU71_05655 [Vibrio lentus]PMK70033.1 hypothetical protein BCT93_05290 [Vibrio lentus]
MNFRDRKKSRQIRAKESYDLTTSEGYIEINESTGSLLREYELTVPSYEGTESLLSELEEKFHKNSLQSLLDTARTQTINSIVPLGIGSKLAEKDQLGGNVDTTHNARKGVYATQEAENRYNERGDYISKDYHHGNTSYNEIQREGSKRVKDGTLIDESNGSLFTFNDNGKTDKNLDHVVSSHEVHNDRGASLAGLDTADLANIQDNLKFINASVNKSKSDMTMDEYLDVLPSRIASKKERINELQSKPSLSNQEQNELKNAENYVQHAEKVDVEKMKNLDQDARDSINKKVDDSYYKSKEFAKNSAISAGKASLKMGLSTAFAEFLSNFLNDLFDEIQDCYRNGKETDSIMAELKVRLKRLVTKSAKNWKKVAEAFMVGSISGFLSELVTILLNMFFTTSKRVVTCVREGGRSLLQALKFAMFPPENISRQEAMHEASKILASGVVVTGGIILEETIEKLIVSTIPFLAPISGIVSGILTGALVAVTSCLAVYLLDRSDILGAIKERRHQFVNDEVDYMLSSSLSENMALSQPQKTNIQ